MRLEYRRVDEEDKGMGDGGAPVASRKMRAWAWLRALAMAGTVATVFLATSNIEKRPHYMKKEGVILIGIPSNRGGAVRAACTM